MIVEKGSVFAVRLAGNISPNLIENGVGAHQNEGFGKLLVNPSFLQSEAVELDFSLTKIEAADWKSKIKVFDIQIGKQDGTVLAYLAQRKKTTLQIFDIDKRVNDFIEKYTELQGISRSQWGLVRNYAKYSIDIDTFETLLFSKELGHLNRGQSEKEWRKNGRREKLKKYLFEEDLPKNYIIPFTIKLAAQMAKTKS